MLSRGERIQLLRDGLQTLSTEQLASIENIVKSLNRPYIKIWHWNESDLFSPCVTENLGDAIRIHHCFSNENFTKDKFEYALERAFKACGTEAELARRGNPGHDITIRGVRTSLKTQAEVTTREHKIHISKFMELGKGDWTDKVSDLLGLREQFFRHMESYDRIFTLRCLSRKPSRLHYELVEIPKALLLSAQNGTLYMRESSKQFPVPGYCDVVDENGVCLFQLYFDGGGERKLQIKHLHKNYCFIHCEWVFSIAE